MKQRKIPLRKCIGCSESFPKKELVRIIKTKLEDGTETVKLDTTGKLNGRGAYICKNMKCFEKAVKSKRLPRTLETEIPNDIYEQIKLEIAKNE
ncbi:YlxR family protein [Sedimentibacter sp. zth1]|uniref:RNase P modulator RnpM n=1 Tax=Sedimentibacter sp. zth1 TaxID=2816908 RepID=UPI001A935FD4|nr:YlxR family protein [Sedimentibacter sp. zth1]QSX06547.1 YlxR family protein [Sedimentibacter sp. zth1]